MSYLDKRTPDEMITAREERAEAAEKVSQTTREIGGATIMATKGFRATKLETHPDQIAHENRMRAQRDAAERDAEFYAQ